MRYDHGSHASDALGHSHPTVLHLRVASLPAQLLDRLDDLVDAAGAHRVAARLEAAAGRTRQLACDPDIAFQRERHCLAVFNKAARLQRERRDMMTMTKPSTTIVQSTALPSHWINFGAGGAGGTHSQCRFISRRGSQAYNQIA